MSLPAPSKSYDEHSTEERLASLDKQLNILVHPDWREVYLRFAEERNDAQHAMDAAPDWETFVAARAIRLFIESRLLNLRDLVNAEKADIEADKAEVGELLPPTEYESE